jgi:hypothetical protein
MTQEHSSNPESPNTGTNTGTNRGADQGSGADKSSPTPEELRENIERTRTSLGETVSALATKTGIRTRAKVGASKAKETVTDQTRHTVDAARQKARTAAQQAQLKGRGLATKARETARSEEARAQARRTGAPAAAAGAVLVAVWMWRRRRARRMTRWQRTMRTAQRIGTQKRDQLRTRATGLAATVRDSDAATQAQARGRIAASELAASARQAAEAPDTKPRAQGAVAATAVLLVLGCLRRSRAARRHEERGER